MIATPIAQTRMTIPAIGGLYSVGVGGAGRGA
jgi:hypothetical protein